MAIEMDFLELFGGWSERIFFLDDLGVAGGVVCVGQVVVEALGEAALGDEFGEAETVGVVGEVDGFSVRRGAADEFVVEGINVGDVGGRSRWDSGDTLGGVAVGVVGVGGETVVGGEGLGLIRQEAG